MNMNLRHKKSIEKEEKKLDNLDLREYQAEINIIKRLFSASKEFGKPVMIGVRDNGSPQMKILSIGELVKKHKLEKLLVALKNTE